MGGIQSLNRQITKSPDAGIKNPTGYQNFDNFSGNYRAYVGSKIFEMQKVRFYQKIPPENI
jgi:hypothetical protein